jgi:Holliday junction resolvasome RuvABC ATP-dependent DNA helicase subunit
LLDGIADGPEGAKGGEGDVDVVVLVGEVGKGKDALAEIVDRERGKEVACNEGELERGVTCRSASEPVI